MGHIGIICAIRQEISPLLKLFPAKRSACFADFPAWEFQAFGQSVSLLQSGIGINNAAGAAKAVAAINPDLIISAGFCGALTPEAAIGELFLAERLYSYSAGLLTPETALDQDLVTRIGAGFKRGPFITAAEIADKALLLSLLPEPAAFNMLEMESSAVATVCRKNSINFIALRSVSDTADQDPGRIFQQICDQEFDVRMAKVALSLVNEPALLGEYLQLYRNTAYAGSTLAKAITTILERFRCFSPGS